MKKLLLLGFLASIITFTACGDEKEENVNVVFQANFGGDVLSFEQEYEMIDGTKFTISRSDMFLSDVRLVADDGSEVRLFDYIQVDFADSPGGIKFIAEDVPNQNYESIQFGLGLNRDQNMTQPIDYPSDDVLNQSGYYWIAWDSYIFSKTEGKVDDTGDGNIDKGWLFHTGKDEMKREVALNIDRELGERSGQELRIVLDHQPLFVKDGEAIELGITHDPSNLEVLGTFIDRMAASFSVK